MFQLNTVVWPSKCLSFNACYYWYGNVTYVVSAKNLRPVVRLFSISVLWHRFSKLWHLPEAHFPHTLMSCLKETRCSLMLRGWELEPWVCVSMKYFGPNIDKIPNNYRFVKYWTLDVFSVSVTFILTVVCYKPYGIRYDLLVACCTIYPKENIKKKKECATASVLSLSLSLCRSIGTTHSLSRSLCLCLSLSVFYSLSVSRFLTLLHLLPNSKRHSLHLKAVRLHKSGLIVVHHFRHFHQNIVGSVMSDLRRGAMTENFGQPVTKAQQWWPTEWSPTIILRPTNSEE